MNCTTQALSAPTVSSQAEGRAHGLAAFVRQQWRAYWERRAQRLTVVMLSALDDQTLRDIGVGRSEIDSVVYSRSGERVRRYDHNWG